MIKLKTASLIEEQFESFRKMILREEVFMLRKDYIHNDTYTLRAFTRILRSLGRLRRTVGANYEKGGPR